MESSSTIEEIQQEEQLENDEKPPDSGGVLFNHIQEWNHSFGGEQLVKAESFISDIVIKHCVSTEDVHVFCI